MIISGTLISFSICQFQDVSQLELHSDLEHAWFYFGFTNGEAMIHFFSWLFFFCLHFAYKRKLSIQPHKRLTAS